MFFATRGKNFLAYILIAIILPFLLVPNESIELMAYLCFTGFLLLIFWYLIGALFAFAIKKAARIHEPLIVVENKLKWSTLVLVCIVVTTQLIFNYQMISMLNEYDFFELPSVAAMQMLIAEAFATLIAALTFVATMNRVTLSLILMQNAKSQHEMLMFNVALDNAKFLAQWQTRLEFNNLLATFNDNVMLKLDSTTLRTKIFN